MKDFHFTAQKQRKELWILGLCILVTQLLNIGSIWFYQTEWKELYTQWLWVLVLACFLYLLLLVFRCFFGFIKQIFSVRKQSTYKKP